jgi:hypothetical protein
MSNDNSDVELIAALVGSTKAGLAGIDKEIIDASSNLQKSDETWNPEQIVKDHIISGGVIPESDVQVPMAQAGTPPPPPPPSQGEVFQPPMQPVQQYQPPPQQATGYAVQVVTREFEDRLLAVEKKLDTILEELQRQTKLDEKISNFVNRGLQPRVKQITLKLDDPKD